MSAWKKVSHETPPPTSEPVLFVESPGAEVKLAHVWWNSNKPGWCVISENWEWFLRAPEEAHWCAIPAGPP